MIWKKKRTKKVWYRVVSAVILQSARTTLQWNTDRRNIIFVHCAMRVIYTFTTGKSCKCDQCKLVAQKKWNLRAHIQSSTWRQDSSATIALQCFIHKRRRLNHSHGGLSCTTQGGIKQLWQPLNVKFVLAVELVNNFTFSDQYFWGKFLKLFLNQNYFFPLISLPWRTVICWRPIQYKPPIAGIANLPNRLLLRVECSLHILCHLQPWISPSPKHSFQSRGRPRPSKVLFKWNSAVRGEGGRGVENPFQMKCGSSSVNTNHCKSTLFAPYLINIYHDIHQNAI